MREDTTDKKLHELIKNYLDFGFKEKNLIKSLMLKLPPDEHKISKHIARLREQVAHLIQPAVEEVMANKNLTEKVDSKFLTSMLTGAMNELLLEYSFPIKNRFGKSIKSDHRGFILNRRFGKISFRFKPKESKMKLKHIAGFVLTRFYFHD